MSTSLKSSPAHFLDSKATEAVEAITLSGILSKLFAVKARESIDAATAGDKSDAAFTWGM